MNEYLECMEHFLRNPKHRKSLKRLIKFDPFYSEENSGIDAIKIIEKYGLTNDDLRNQLYEFNIYLGNINYRFDDHNYCNVEQDPEQGRCENLQYLSVTKENIEAFYKLYDIPYYDDNADESNYVNLGYINLTTGHYVFNNKNLENLLLDLFSNKFAKLKTKKTSNNLSNIISKIFSKFNIKKTSDDLPDIIEPNDSIIISEFLNPNSDINTIIKRLNISSKNVRNADKLYIFSLADEYIGYISIDLTVFPISANQQRYISAPLSSNICSDKDKYYNKGLFGDYSMKPKYYNEALLVFETKYNIRLLPTCINSELSIFIKQNLKFFNIPEFLGFLNLREPILKNAGIKLDSTIVDSTNIEPVFAKNKKKEYSGIQLKFYPSKWTVALYFKILEEGNKIGINMKLAFVYEGGIMFRDNNNRNGCEIRGFKGCDVHHTKSYNEVATDPAYNKPIRTEKYLDSRYRNNNPESKYCIEFYGDWCIDYYTYFQFINILIKCGCIILESNIYLPIPFGIGKQTIDLSLYNNQTIESVKSGNNYRFIYAIIEDNEIVYY